MADEKLDENEKFEPSPEDFLPAPPKRKTFLQRIPDMQSMNPALGLFVLFLIMSFLYWNGEFPGLLWASKESVFVRNEHWRLFTALFIHADAMHLLDNSILFLIFGSLLYFFYGGIVFPLSALLIGGLTTLTSAYFHEPQIRLLGASGMIYGMVGIWIVLYVCYDINYSLPMRFLRAVGFCLVILFPTSFHIEVDYKAHAIGFAYGIFAGILLIPFTKKRVDEFYRNSQKSLH